MKTVNFLLDGFGFKDSLDFKTSLFGHVMSTNVFKLGVNLGFLGAIVNDLFGFDWVFLIGYVILICLEWFTGVQASFKKGQKHESRKLGRMMLKISIYSLFLICLNLFHSRTQFPQVFSHELDPFLWLYWTVLIVIIWQLVISVLENLDVLEFKWAAVLLKIINRKFYKHYEITDDTSKSTT